jgi:hypothetical protein
VICSGVFFGVCTPESGAASAPRLDDRPSNPGFIPTGYLMGFGRIVPGTYQVPGTRYGRYPLAPGTSADGLGNGTSWLWIKLTDVGSSWLRDVRIFPW